MAIVKFAKTIILAQNYFKQADAVTFANLNGIEGRFCLNYIGRMARYRVTYVGQSMEQSWAVERIDDEGGTALLRSRYKLKEEAEAEALRLNLLAAAKDT